MNLRTTGRGLLAVPGLASGLLAGGAVWFVLAICFPAAARAQFSYEVLHEFILDGSNSEASLIQAADGNLYGTTSLGGAANWGAVFKMDTSGNLTTVYSFTGGIDGAKPTAALLQAANGAFYGTTSTFGTNGLGTAFRLTSSGDLTTLHTFSGSDGSAPTAALIQATDGHFYGTTSHGGANDLGTVFEMDSSGNVTTLHSFAEGEGANPKAGLVQGSDGSFYGTTEFGGAGGYGTVFKMDSFGNLATLHGFTGADGSYPRAFLIQAADGFLYGTTYAGGANDYGTAFKIDFSGGLTTLHSFQFQGGIYPSAGLIQAADGNFYGTTSGSGGGLGTVYRMDAVGNLTWMHTFTWDDGAGPVAGLVQAADGDFYGTTNYGGFNYGTVFKIDSQANRTTLHYFGYSEGTLAYGGVIQAADGNFYGTTYGGGKENVGTVFQMDPAGKLTTLHEFASHETPTNGNYPVAGVIQATDGNFYGTTDGGGANNSGTVFRIDSEGNFTVLYSFYAYPGDGVNPFGGLIEATDGYFYGTTANGGTSGVGTVFKMDPLGNATVLHSFANYPVDGAIPQGSLIQAFDGSLYGLTTGGGVYGYGSAFKVDASGYCTIIHNFTQTDGNPSPVGLVQSSDGFFYGTTGGSNLGGYGTVFKMDSSGNLTILHRFSISDGATPQGSLIQGPDGNFYGTTVQGGASLLGTIFRMDPAGNVMPIHHFTGDDGASPYSALIWASDGGFYGTTAFGPGSSKGVVYRFEACAPAPAPVIKVDVCMASDSPGFTASVPGETDDTYIWTLTGGTIDSGQGTNSIQFTSAEPGTLMSLSVLETNTATCSGAAFVNIQVAFADAPPSDPFHEAICTVARNRISVGCGAGNFCPAATLKRAQAAVLLLKAEHGPGYLPPGCAGVFADVPCPSSYANWIEQLAAEGITAGCGNGSFCPDDPVSRAQIAPLLLKARYGPAYAPLPAAGVFGDVPPSAFAAEWIEDLYRRSITVGCSAHPLLYCPSSAVTRGQAAAFIAGAFDLQ